MHTYIYTRFKNNTACYRVAKKKNDVLQGSKKNKTPKMPSLSRSFSAKEPCRQWLFFEKRHATQGILCIFATLYVYNAPI